MSHKIEDIIIRFLFIPVSGLFAYLSFTETVKSLNDLSYRLTENGYDLYVKFYTRDQIVFWATIVWITACLITEIAAALSVNFKFRRLLTNLRYAPLSVFAISFFAIAVYDAGMICYSKQQIRNYVFNNLTALAEPEIQLHNNYRSWCGNGFIAQENHLYFGTAAEGIKDENPFVRARSLLMMKRVSNWFNGGDQRYDNYLAESCLDFDKVVRDAAEELLKTNRSSCRKYLAEK